MMDSRTFEQKILEMRQEATNLKCAYERGLGVVKFYAAMATVELPYTSLGWKLTATNKKSGLFLAQVLGDANSGILDLTAPSVTANDNSITWSFPRVPENYSFNVYVISSSEVELTWEAT